MSERAFRIIIGSALIVFLSLQLDALVWACVALFVFEGLTNLRVPILVSRLRHGKAALKIGGPPGADARIPLEAERALRLVFACVFALSLSLASGKLWFLPWFISFMLLGAGLTNICPGYMMLRWIGFSE